MSSSDQLKCGRCAAVFPEVHIVKCERVTAGGLVLCYVCHKRLHPRCTMEISVIHPSDRLCNRCLKVQAVIVCPQCSVKENVQSAPRPKPSKKKYTVAVEGNIGCGKSTFLKYFKKTHNVEVFPEPVNKWKDVHGFNTLEKMYNDAKRWSLAFQSYVQLTMVDIHSKETEHGIKLIERSLYSARYCFVENLYRSCEDQSSITMCQHGYDVIMECPFEGCSDVLQRNRCSIDKLMPEVDYAILSEFYNWLQENQDMHVDLLVYLQATPETCQERIRARNRHEEQSVPIDYLQSLHVLHEDWLIHQNKFKAPCPVLVINTDCDLQEMYKRFDKHKDSILQRNKENLS